MHSYVHVQIESFNKKRMLYTFAIIPEKHNVIHSINIVKSLSLHPNIAAPTRMVRHNFVRSGVLHLEA